MGGGCFGAFGGGSNGLRCGFSSSQAAAKSPANTEATSQPKRRPVLMKQILVPPSGVAAKLISRAWEMDGVRRGPHRDRRPGHSAPGSSGCGMLRSDLTLSATDSPNRPQWLLAGSIALGAFATSILAQVFVLLLNQAAGTTSIAKETPLTLVRGALLVQSALALLIGLVLSRSRELRKRTLRFGRVPLGPVLASLGLTRGIAPLAHERGVRLSEALHVPSDTSVWVALIVRQATRGELVLLGIALTIVPAFVEELLFRGLLMGALEGAHRVTRLCLPALLFGAFHIDWAQGAATFVLGLGFGFLRVTTRSLWMPIIAHAAYNSLVLVTMRSTGAAEAGTHQAIAVLVGGLLLAVACASALERGYRRNLLAPPGVD